MRRCSLTRVRATALVAALTFAVALLSAAGAAQAMVITDQSSGLDYGVSLADSSSGLPGNVSAVTGGPQCQDPAFSLYPDLSFPSPGLTPLCWNNGPVMHSNKTYALTWDPHRTYWQTTRNYVEQYLRDVADGSGQFGSPFAETTQYWDGSSATARAGNDSVYGGGCIDYGVTGGSACQWDNVNASGPGRDYTGSGLPSCSVTGWNQFAESQSGAWGPSPTNYCVTDAQIQWELGQMINQTLVLAHNNFSVRKPLFVVLTPPDTVACLDSSGTLCSGNSSANARFCSYHGDLNVSDLKVSGFGSVSYVVQPWTASWDAPATGPARMQTFGCDDPTYSIDKPIPYDPAPDSTTLATDVGQRLISPLSQVQMASIINPQFTGWYANNGAEIYDNGCIGLKGGLDNVTAGTGSYVMRRESNDSGVIQNDPNSLACTPNVNLAPAFVVPSAANPGDEIWFDGSTTVASLVIPKIDYVWSFGDGTSAEGPSVVHSYSVGGTYSVKLTVTDLGGNSRTLTQQVVVLGANGQPVPTPPSSPTGGNGGSQSAFSMHLILLPESFKAVLRTGVALEVQANKAANGFAEVSIPRAAAKRAQIKVGRGPSVVIGRGTVSSIRNGTITLRLALSRATTAKLKRLRHVTLTIRLRVVAANGAHQTYDIAGRY